MPLNHLCNVRADGVVSTTEVADSEDDAVVVASVGCGRYGDTLLQVRLNRVAGTLP